MADNSETPVFLVLPTFVRSSDDVRTLMGEILHIEEFLYKAQVRETGAKMSLPRTTAILDKFAEANKRNVINHKHRIELAKFLRGVYKLAPVITLTTGTKNNKQIVDGVIEWFRSHVHAQTLVRTNIKNDLGPGCFIRIKHKSYNFLLNERFDKSAPVLMESLNEMSKPATQSGRRQY
jgi:hypothetical protein